MWSREGKACVSFRAVLLARVFRVYAGPFVPSHLPLWGLQEWRNLGPILYLYRISSRYLFLIASVSKPNDKSQDSDTWNLGRQKEFCPKNPEACYTYIYSGIGRHIHIEAGKSFTFLVRLSGIRQARHGSGTAEHLCLWWLTSTGVMHAIPFVGNV